jgi:hypothetical protein
MQRDMVNAELKIVPLESSLKSNNFRLSINNIIYDIYTSNDKSLPTVLRVTLPVEPPTRVLSGQRSLAVTFASLMSASPGFPRSFYSLGELPSLWQTVRARASCGSKIRIN